LNGDKWLHLIMSIAYVFLNCDIGYEKSVIAQLQQIDVVKEVHGTHGSYDILAKLESLSNEELSQAISYKVRKFKNVKSSMTLLAMG